MPDASDSDTTPVQCDTPDPIDMIRGLFPPCLPNLGIINIFLVVKDLEESPSSPDTHSFWSPWYELDDPFYCPKRFPVLEKVQFTLFFITISGDALKEKLSRDGFADQLTVLEYSGMLDVEYVY
ncbi:hypothetical protein PM082_011922 [Marasmius tenuissimus]|nr:hypothetical protein PM082_011922 [Marasmius tenuissimus]